MNRTVRFITTSPPAPGISGDRIRMFSLIRQLTLRGWDVRVWSLVAENEPEGIAEDLQGQSCDVVLFRQTVTRWQRVARFLGSAARGRAYHHAWFASAAGQREAAEWLSDVGDEPIVVQQLFMMPFVPQSLFPQVVLDTHNLEFARMRSIADGDGRWLRRLAARAQVGPVLRYEESLARRVALLLAVSDEEQMAFEVMAPGRVRLVPNGVDVHAVSPLVAPPRSTRLLFLGSLSYSPNLDAVRYFSTDISRLLTDSGAHLAVVGSNPNGAIRSLLSKSRIPTTLEGFVRDLGPAFRDSRMMVVPLRHGAGTRLKILEALARGLPVVTTTIGAEGIGVVDREHVLIADDPHEFAVAVRQLLLDDELWVKLSVAGRRFVLQRFDWDLIGVAIDEAIRDVADELAERHGPPPSDRSTGPTEEGARGRCSKRT